MFGSVSSKLQRATAVLVASVVALVGAVVIAAPAQAAANRTSQKVTVCHRTHAVTNPYRQITVSVNSVIKNNGHDDSTHNPSYSGKPVFDPTFTYPNNQKQWEDIIPAFSYTVTQGQNTNTITFPGRNWSAVGQAIFYGLEYNGTNYAGLCSSQGAKEFLNEEFADWLADNPGANNGQITSKKRDILDDLRDQEAEGDPSTSTLNDRNLDPNTLPSTPKKPRGPERGQSFQNRIQAVDAQNANRGNNPINQALSGVVWKDLDSDGIQDVSEGVFANTGIRVIDPTTNQVLSVQDLALVSMRAAGKQSFVFSSWQGEPTYSTSVATTVTVNTDADGYFEIASLPEGDWIVEVVTPSGWTYTYDSTGAGDGAMPGTYVPSGGVGFAWAGLVQTSSSGGGTNSQTGGSNSSAGIATSLELSQTGAHASLYVIALIVAGGLVLAGALMVSARKRR